jgi:hypothetical protein
MLNVPLSFIPLDVEIEPEVAFAVASAKVPAVIVVGPV